MMISTMVFWLMVYIFVVYDISYVKSDAILFSHSLTWNEANQFCENINKTLLTIDSVGKEKQLIKELSQTNIQEFWIGLHVLDPNDPKGRNWTSNCSPESYQNWAQGVSSDSINLCTYAFESVSMVGNGLEWDLSVCDSSTKPFICEDKIDFCSSFIYEEVVDKKCFVVDRGDPPFSNGDATPDGCKTVCDDLAEEAFCWGFLLNRGINRCRPYSIVDDPYAVDACLVSDNGYSTYIRRCLYSVTVNEDVLTPPIYQSCGQNIPSSQCACRNYVTTEPMMSTQKYSTSCMTSVETTPVGETVASVTTTSATTTNAKGLSSTEGTCFCTCGTPSQEETFEKTLKEMRVDKKKTSLYKRKLTSAPDDRLSAKSIGFVGIFVLLAVCLILTYNDILRLLIWIYGICKGLVT